MNSAISGRLRRTDLVAPRHARTPSLLTIAAATVGSLVVAAAVNRHLAAKAERGSPPTGRFIEVDGVKLHFVDQGTGDPLVMLHGNGSMIQDFACSGLIDLAAKERRVIAFDRPGFGHSESPRTSVWTADAQATLLQNALAKMGISTATVFGHSWGASVAVAMALRYPGLVRELVLASGYYYPTSRIDTVASVAAASPVFGDFLSLTLSPLLGRVMWPITMARMFGPKSEPGKFRGFPRGLALRPSQLRAAAAESALMGPGAVATSGRYGELKMPVSIVAGDQDRLIDTESQSARLHSDIAHSSFRRIAANGHMIQQTATEDVLSAIREASNGPTATTTK